MNAGRSTNSNLRPGSGPAHWRLTKRIRGRILRTSAGRNRFGVHEVEDLEAHRELAGAGDRVQEPSLFDRCRPVGVLHHRQARPAVDPTDVADHRRGELVEDEELLRQVVTPYQASQPARGAVDLGPPDAADHAEGASRFMPRARPATRGRAPPRPTGRAAPRPSGVTAVEEARATGLHVEQEQRLVPVRSPHVAAGPGRRGDVVAVVTVPSPGPRSANGDDELVDRLHAGIEPAERAGRAPGLVSHPRRRRRPDHSDRTGFGGSVVGDEEPAVPEDPRAAARQLPPRGPRRQPLRDGAQAVVGRLVGPVGGRSSAAVSPAVRPERPSREGCSPTAAAANRVAARTAATASARPRPPGPPTGHWKDTKRTAGRIVRTRAGLKRFTSSS